MPLIVKQILPVISILANKENSMENRLTDVKMLGVNFERALQKEIKTNCNIWKFGLYQLSW